MAQPRGIILVATIDMAAFLVGIAGTALAGHRAFLSFAVGTIALVTFFGALTVQVPGVSEVASGESRVRRAIALAIVAVYLVLVATTAFFTTPVQLEGLLLNFTTTTGVVIAFYFGSSAYVEAQSLRDDRP
jgi:hypothetical protein